MLCLDGGEYSPSLYNGRGQGGWVCLLPSGRLGVGLCVWLSVCVFFLFHFYCLYSCLFCEKLLSLCAEIQSRDEEVNDA